MFIPKDKVILHQNEKGDDLYVLLSGKVKVTLLNKDGREVVLDILHDGDFFGELSLFDSEPRSATVTALEDTALMIHSRDSFLMIIKENPEIAIKIFSVLAKRLRKANETIETLTFLDVTGRVAKLLLDIAAEDKEILNDGFVKIPCPTHQAIANRIGASREAVTKALKTLIANGLIKINGRELTIAPKHFELL
jgi:CRP/FNR family transcriptional regulator/CRP/FNR family cyclic AMP-dependent transcriptional regulator